jgi:hypothetical protein
MRRSRSTTFTLVVAVAAALSLLLSGCSSAHAGSGSTPTSHHASVKRPDNCDSFNKLSESARDAAFKGQTIRVYGADGAVKTPAVNLYDTGCANHHGDYYLLDNIKIDAAEPSCSVFVNLTAAQQQKWLPALKQEQYWHGDFTASTLASACQKFGFAANGDNMVRLANELIEFPSGYASWNTETKLGYSWTNVIGPTTPETGSAVTKITETAGADSSGAAISFTPGSACGFDPKTDAIIPLSLGYANTTKGKDTITLAATWQLNVVSGTEPITTAYLESHLTDGTSSCSQAADGFGSAMLSVNFPKASDGEDTQDFYVVLKNWFSPRYPSGATGDLDDYVLTSVASSASSDDPVVSSTSGTILLNGSAAD